MDKPMDEVVVNAACEAAWPEFRSHLEGQQAWIDADPLRQNRLRLIVIQALTTAQQQGQVVMSSEDRRAMGWPAGNTAPPSAPVGVEWTDERIIAACKAAGVRWIEADEEEGGFPGGFDITHMPEMRRLFAALALQPAAVLRNDGNTEADFIAHEANACTACGGSGHKADQQPAAVDGVVQAWISDNDLLKLGESIDEARNIRISKKRTHLRVHPIYIPALATQQGGAK